MKNTKDRKFEAIVVAVVLIGTALLVPLSTGINLEQSNDTLYEDPGTFYLDRDYILEDPDIGEMSTGTYDDAGTRRDAGNAINRATPVYPGEPIDNTPGRLRSGAFQTAADSQDWYVFCACAGQDVALSVTPGLDYDVSIALYNDDEEVLASSDVAGLGGMEAFTYTIPETDKWYFVIEAIESGEIGGEYSFTVDMLNQNDVGIGDDAGDDLPSATFISTGEYAGYLDMNDEQDWYRFDVPAGKGIHFDLQMKKTAYYSDFDICLYTPSGELVVDECRYYNDELWYMADVSGEWAVKIDIFPGYTDIPQPTEWDYYTYGSGAYLLEYTLENDAPDPLAPIEQPDIIPVAKSFTVENDPSSNKDEFGYLAAIPAANYLEDGQRYLAPIFYQGDDHSTNYFDTEYDRGVVDDTVQYLIDDWNDYLSLNGKIDEEKILPADPVVAAAEIAVENWESSDLAVIAVDGSEVENAVDVVISQSATLDRGFETTRVESDDPVMTGALGYTEFVMPKWGALTVGVYGHATSGTNDDGAYLDKLFPNYINYGADWWPCPYDGSGGEATDIFMPVTTMGLYGSLSPRSATSWDYMEFTKIAGDRYHFKVTSEDQAIFANLETSAESDLVVFLVDPDGHLRSPDVPQWNGPVNEIHEWNGFEGEGDDWRVWDPEPHTSFETNVLHPNIGRWTAIVVPRHADTGSTDYELTVEIHTVDTARNSAVMSAANAAVIASQEHAPLLYVDSDSVPAETQAALTALGVDEVIFVDLDGVASAVKADLPTVRDDLTTEQELVDFIKAYDSSENYITITSLKSGDGYFASAAMLAAYHGSPVLRIGNCGSAASAADRVETMRLWSGDYYHGSRSTGHLPVHTEPLDGTSNFAILMGLVKFALGTGDLPPLGMDAKRYWNEEVHDGIHEYIDDLGLDRDGQEAYCFVAPRKDIYLICHSVMMGNNSYAGHMPGETPAYTSALVVRNLLYPALIFANPGRDVTTTQLMNYPDGGAWKTNDGENHNVYSSREVKYAFSSHGREYEGHCLWVAHLERMNEGASVMYYSGHGTGGSGISAQPHEFEHCSYPEEVWSDAWRGYSYDNWKTARNNGRVWYNSHGSMVYDIIHYDYVDGLMENLRSNAVFYMSCTTGDAFGPMVYLDHGAVIWYGNAGSGLCPEADLQDDEFFADTMLDGESIGQAFSHQVWLHYRDFTTGDPTSMYGSSSMQVTTVQVIYGDPSLVVYTPEWTMPVAIDA